MKDKGGLALPMERRILLLRGQRIMLSHDLAVLYGVETKALMQAVRRNMGRFQPDFMFQLTPEEAGALRSHFVTLEPSGGLAGEDGMPSSRRGRHPKYRPYAFTQEGVAMLSSVLRSERAVRVNIEIMRAFVRLRRMLSAHADLSRRLDTLEARYDKQFKAVFEAIRELMATPEKPKKTIGFRVKEKKARYR